MAKQSVGVPLPVFDRLDTDPVLSLYRQIYERIRGTILSGSLAPGTRLPSSRTLAADLRVSRNTVEIAFTQLEAEGFLIRKVGAGTYVASAIPELERAPRRFGMTAVRPAARSGREPLSLRGRNTVSAAGRAEVWVRSTSRPLAPQPGPRGSGISRSFRWTAASTCWGPLAWATIPATRSSIVTIGPTTFPTFSSATAAVS